MPTVITFTPLEPPRRMPVRGRGRLLRHVCRDAAGGLHRQRLALGSVRGVFYLDAVCLHCGAHFVWVDEDPADGAATEGAAAPEASDD